MTDLDLDAIRAASTRPETVWTWNLTEGQESSVFHRFTGNTSEHRNLRGDRSTCVRCADWCYPFDPCACCHPLPDHETVLALCGEVERLRAELVLAGETGAK